MKADKSFLGRGWSFPPTFDRQARGVVMTSNEEDIEKSLEILLSTRIGERYLQPSYGCDISDYVFMGVNNSEAYLKEIISDAIIFHEPRIELEKVSLETDTNNGLVCIEIIYMVVATNTRYNYVYPFYLSEGTDLVR